MMILPKGREEAAAIAMRERERDQWRSVCRMREQLMVAVSRMCSCRMLGWMVAYAFDIFLSLVFVSFLFSSGTVY